MPAVLPTLVEDDTPAIAALLRSPRGDRDMALRSMLPKWLSRYGISLPERYRDVAFQSPPRPRTNAARQLTVSFSDYNILDVEGRSLTEVAAIWATVEDEAPWPGILQSDGGEYA